MNLKSLLVKRSHGRYGHDHVPDLTKFHDEGFFSGHLLLLESTVSPPLTATAARIQLMSTDEGPPEHSSSLLIPQTSPVALSSDTTTYANTTPAFAIQRIPPAIPTVTPFRQRKGLPRQT